MNTLFATFNVNGLNADAKRKTIFNYLKQKNFEIIQYCCKKPILPKK